MSIISYKCPNCSGGLIFNPTTQDFKCEYCASHFSKEQLEKADVDTTREDKAEKNDPPKQEKSEPMGEDRSVVFSCPSCGAEVVTDETTAATYCYYCHNPVVLSGRLSGNFRPDLIIPFSIEREEAIQHFLEWVKKKWFVPKSFFSKKQIEKITGIYFPHWMVDCQLHGSYTGQATKIRTWRQGNTQYTETRFFTVEREGDIQFKEIVKNALNKDNCKLVNGVQPFDMIGTKEFVPAYLSGFQAEKRNIEADALKNDLENEVHNYSKDILRGSIQGYTTVAPADVHINDLKLNWKYTLFPVWVLTYQAHDKKIYFYAMNGQNGKVNGVLPISFKKLLLVCGGIAATLFTILTIGGILF